MDLSVIIVSYNVKYFLEQCLCSVKKAIAGIDAEILVVDNNSSDGSMAYLQPLFPDVRFIISNDNLGFGKANNLALGMATGQYILFLNPDTIVPEDCFAKSISFLEANPQYGALGIKMIDGNGNFLAESKRSFPSLPTSFYKLTGLSSMFPKSRTFNRYALGNLDENNNHDVDVLCGAFMMLRKEVAIQTKGFDEAFFMYGEDIDLSYRIQQLGYRNCYFAGSSIIHFKGESAGQQSMKHNRMFYDAMLVFVKKHYGTKKTAVFSILLQMAIVLRAALGFVGRAFSSIKQQKKIRNSYLLLGDEASIHSARALLNNGNAAIETVIASESSLQQLPLMHDKNIVVCQGENFSYQSAIQFIHQCKKKNNYWFYSIGSNSIVGSNSKGQIGETLHR